MNNASETVFSHEKIMQEFDRILSEHAKASAGFDTKTAAANKAGEQTIVAEISQFTPEKIVKSLADLQLSTSDSIIQLAGNLKNELEKLDKFKKSIQFESARLAEIRKIKIVAEAISLKEQQNAEKMKTLEADITQKNQDFDAALEKARENWKIEQQEFDLQQKEKQAELKKMREKEEADYQYELKKKRKIEADEFENKKRLLDQKLKDEGETRGEKWAERQAAIDALKAEFEANQQRIASFEKEIQTACEQAEKEIVTEINEDAAVTAELLKREVEATQQINELKIKSLEATIEKNKTRIKEVSGQLENALKQVQALAVKTVESTKKGEAEKANSEK